MHKLLLLPMGVRIGDHHSEKLIMRQETVSVSKKIVYQLPHLVNHERQVDQIVTTRIAATSLLIAQPKMTMCSNGKLR